MTKPTKVATLYKGKVEIEFYEGYHTYKMNGKRLISVTACTGIIDKSGPLMWWAVGLTKAHLLENINKEGGIDELVIEEACKQHQLRKEKAATIGSMVHEWAEKYINKEKPRMPKNKNVLNGVIAFLKWVEDHKVKFVASEKLVYSKKHDFVGLMDVVYKEKGKLVAGDFKTSKSGHYPEYKFQLAAYRGADEEESKVKYDRRVILHFDKENGEFEAIECEEHEKDYKAFLACLAIKRRLNELK